MSEAIKKSRIILDYLSVASPKYIKGIIASADKDLIRAITEISMNVLFSDLGLSETIARRLRPYKKYLRELAKKSVGIEKKRKILKTHGHKFLSVLLPPVLSIISNII
jgi:hypothetical protein